MNMTEIACFLALLMGLRSSKTCNQGNKYMVMCVEQYCALMYAIYSIKE